MKKLLILNTLYPPDVIGGAELSVESLAQSLSSDFEITVVAISPTNTHSRSNRNGVTVIKTKNFNISPYRTKQTKWTRKIAWHSLHNFNPWMDRFLSRLIEHNRPDLLHTHNLLSLSTSVWREAAKRGIPVVHTIRDRGLLCPFHMVYRKRLCDTQCYRCSIYNLIRKHHSRYVDSVVGISNDILESHLQAGYFSKARSARVIYNAVADYSQDRPKTQRQIQFGFLGTISFNKGIEHLLTSFQNIKEHNLLVAGEGDKEYVDGVVSQFGRPNITFLGRQDPSLFFSSIDFLVVPSFFREPFGRVVAEAFSAGIPVIASSHGSFSELIRDGDTGFTFDINAPQSLENVIRRATTLSMPERERMSQACMRTYDERFRLDIMRDNYLQVYRELNQG